jgi:hypothetical protein
VCAHTMIKPPAWVISYFSKNSVPYANIVGCEIWS